jgi:hypothetical protein
MLKCKKEKNKLIRNLTDLGMVCHKNINRFAFEYELDGTHTVKYENSMETSNDEHDPKLLRTP